MIYCEIKTLNYIVRNGGIEPPSCFAVLAESVVIEVGVFIGVISLNCCNKLHSLIKTHINYI